MKKNVAAGVLLSLLIMGGLMWYNFHTSEKETLISYRKLKSATKIGEITPLIEIADIRQKEVCILYPYQDSVQNHYPQADRINQHLRSIKYVGDEGYWALVFVDKFRVTITKFHRSATLDIIAKQQLTNKEREELPINFEPENGAQAEEAAFFKLLKDGRYYLIFGRIH